VGTTAYNGLDEAIRSSIEAGVVYVLAAGNEGVDASTVTPAHVAEAITVGAYDAGEAFSWFSNHGPVVDILAPGEDVEVLYRLNTITWTSGTSVAAPHVAGAAALLLARRPRMTPAQVRETLVSHGRPGITAGPAGTTDVSVYVGDF